MRAPRPHELEPPCVHKYALIDPGALKAFYEQHAQQTVKPELALSIVSEALDLSATACSIPICTRTLLSTTWQSLGGVLVNR